MRNVIIETEVQYQLNDLKDYLISIQGERKGKSTFADIMLNIDNLEQFGDVGRNIKEYFNIDCPEVRNLKIIGVNDVLNDKGHGCVLFSLSKHLHLTNRP